MPGTLVQTLATGTCLHGGQAVAAGTAARVLLSGQPAVKATDTHTVAGCPFQIPVGAGTKPSPCVTASQFVPATRVLVEGVPAVLNTSPGIGKSPEQAPQGPVTFSVTQPRVTGI
jgi:hypothetical protein